jgi:hypothetical protein
LREYQFELSVRGTSLHFLAIQIVHFLLQPQDSLLQICILLLQRLDKGKAGKGIGSDQQLVLRLHLTLQVHDELLGLFKFIPPEISLTLVLRNLVTEILIVDY